MSFSKEDIQEYLDNVCKAISDGRCQISRNTKRTDNLLLFSKFLITEEDAYDIIKRLTPLDFCEAVQNEHLGFEEELLYVFGKDVKLLKRFGGPEKVRVSLYIKFNYLKSHYVFVISFHEQKWPLSYYFNQTQEDTVK